MNIASVPPLQQQKLATDFAVYPVLLVLADVSWIGLSAMLARVINIESGDERRLTHLSSFEKVPL